jgi:hypothetical protein
VKEVMVGACPKTLIDNTKNQSVITFFITLIFSYDQNIISAWSFIL